MARPRKEPKEVVSIRMSAVGRQLWTKMAALDGVRQAEFLEALIRREAKRRKVTTVPKEGEPGAVATVEEERNGEADTR